MTEETTEPSHDGAAGSAEGAVAAAPARAPESFKAILGIKRGMTQVYASDGRLCATTVVEAGPCTVMGVRTQQRDGYSAVRLGLGSIPEGRVTKPLLGQFKAAGIAPARRVREVRVPSPEGFAAGQIVDIEGRFAPLDYVDVQGITKGRGFQGVMKRHGFHGLPGSHGASDKERSPGSLTSRRSLGRVLPGQRMAGHMGHVLSTSQKIEVIRVEPESRRLYLNGSVPGAAGSLVVVFQTVKERKKRIIRKVETVLRDKMGNIIKGKGAKARAAIEAKQKTEAKPKA